MIVMRPTNSMTVVFVVVLMAVSHTRAHAQAATELNPAQRAEVDSGGVVLRTEERPESPWPRACVYLRVDDTPEAGAAVFADYERHVGYMPNVRASKISRVLDSATKEVDYVLHVMPMIDERFTSRDHVARYGEAGFLVEWMLVRATSTKASEGSARFEPLHAPGSTPNPASLFAYCNFVVPGSRLARLGLVKSRATQQVVETARAIATQIAYERANDRALLERQLTALRSMLGR
jgi:hypothetical protein